MSRLYRFLLLAFPAAFRDRFADDMTSVFHDRLAVAQRRGFLAVSGLWMRTIGDLLRHGLAERRKGLATGSLGGRARMLMADIRHAVRALRQRPGFTAAALVTLALGIGANTAIFSILHALLIRPLPYPDADQIVQMYGTHRLYHFTRGSSNPFDFDYIEHRTQTLAFLSTTRNGTTTLTGAGEPVRLKDVDVMPSFFDVMQVRPALGSPFTSEQARDGAAVVVISDAIWTTRFGRRPDIVGSTVTLDDRPTVVVGVMPAGFSYPAEVDFWRPMTLTAKERATLGSWYFGVIARLKPGVTLDAGREEFDLFAAELAAAYPKERGDRGFTVVRLQEDLASRAADAIRLLQGVVLVVLLVACANVANLLLALASGRSRELAVRAALGASRGRLILQWLTESVVLALAGALLGVILAIFAVRAIVGFAPVYVLPPATPIEVSWTVLVYTAFVAVVTGILFGVAPALISTSDLTGALTEGTRSAPAGLTFSRRHWLRASLVATEVALALVLFIGAGLLVRSFSMLMRQPTGVVTDHVLTAQLSLPSARYATVDVRREFWGAVVERLGALPGVRHAAAANALPYSLWEWQAGFQIKGRESSPNDGAGIRAVTPHLFVTLGIPVLRGRPFAAADTDLSAPVAIISDAFARQFLSGLDPLGQLISYDDGSHWAAIVGVVGSTRHIDLKEAPRPEMYFPAAQYRGGTTMLLALKTESEPSSYAAAVRRVISDLDAALPVVEIKTLDDLVTAKRAESRFATTLMTAFAVLAGVLAVTGIGGVVAYLVTQGRREIGIRLALGARSGQVQRRVVRQGLLVVGLGAAAGMAAALWLTGLLEAELFNVTPTDPVAFAAAVAAIFTAAAIACWLPAARISRVDAARVLRE